MEEISKINVINQIFYLYGTFKEKFVSYDVFSRWCFPIVVVYAFQVQLQHCFEIMSVKSGEERDVNGVVLCLLYFWRKTDAFCVLNPELG